MTTATSRWSYPRTTSRSTRSESPCNGGNLSLRTSWRNLIASRWTATMTNTFKVYMCCTNDLNGDRSCTSTLIRLIGRKGRLAGTITLACLLQLLGRWCYITLAHTMAPG